MQAAIKDVESKLKRINTNYTQRKATAAAIVDTVRESYMSTESE